MPYLTGDSDYSQFRTITISFPDTFGLRVAVRGALLDLTREEVWEELGSMTPAQAAQHMTDAFEGINEFIP